MTCCCGPVRLVHNISRSFIYDGCYVPSVAQQGKQCVQNNITWKVKNATEKGKRISGIRIELFAFAIQVQTVYDSCKFDVAPAFSSNSFAASVKKF